jgi:hypothetical protein
VTARSPHSKSSMIKELEPFLDDNRKIREKPRPAMTSGQS